ncbi:uncharacterized protein [Haliotis cracherodii]|uniref:uncharacterized protein n=1 Tax=Haliotis cracherodii TaxID=6455 RepID=UPI0039E9974E
MPTFHAKDTLYRARRFKLPPLPAHRRDLVIPDQFQTLDAGKQFLLINDGDDNKILDFSTTSNLLFLCAADTIYGDGTFYVTPRLFYQLYTLHALATNKMVPLVFLLLPDKKKETYDRAFRLVKDAAENRGFQLLPQTIQMDFEAAANIAALGVFPIATWKGFFIHYTQCLWRKAQQVGLQSAYGYNPEVKTFVKRCDVLPMVPVEESVSVDLGYIIEGETHREMEIEKTLPPTPSPQSQQRTSLP